MINILLNGCNGHMGQVITKLVEGRKDCRICAGIDVNTKSENNYPVFPSAITVLSNIEPDVIIDFSHPSALPALLDFAVSRDIPIVISTTGLSSNDIESVKEASKSIAVLRSANMSVGICLVKDLIKRASQFLGDDFDVEIVERHHNRKVDAPSGTALALADAVNSVNDDKFDYVYDRHSKTTKRSDNEIGLSAVRGGNIVGDHEVIFAGNNEVIEINHHALSRDVFADGSIRAALFLSGKEPGLYNMDDIIREF